MGQGASSKAPLYTQNVDSSGNTGPAGSASSPFVASEPDGTVPSGSPFSVASASVLFTYDTTQPSGNDSVVVQVTSPGTGCTLVFEASNDNTNWLSAQMTQLSNLGNSTDIASQTSGGMSAGAIFIGQCNARYFRARVSTYGSGTVTAAVVLRSSAAFPRSVYVGGAATLTVNPTPVSPSSAVTFTCIDARIKAAATTNATSLKGSAGNIYDIHVYNNTAAAKFLKLYDKSSAPTVGTDTPKFTVIIPANGVAAITPQVPYRFGTGIAYAITGAIADTDTTATAIDDVTGILHYA